MAAIKTVQFLPDIFRTDTNRKFLNATLDQLVSEPKFKKLNGYIGRKLSPSYKSTDSYIEEATSDRQNYQLEPSVIIKDPITDDGTKKSATGLLSVIQIENNIKLIDKVDWKIEETGMLKTIYKNGDFENKTNLIDIRKKLK